MDLLFKSIQINCLSVSLKSISYTSVSNILPNSLQNHIVLWLWKGQLPLPGKIHDDGRVKGTGQFLPYAFYVSSSIFLEVVILV